MAGRDKRATVAPIFGEAARAAGCEPSRPLPPGKLPEWLARIPVKADNAYKVHPGKLACASILLSCYIHLSRTLIE